MITQVSCVHIELRETSTAAKYASKEKERSKDEGSYLEVVKPHSKPVDVSPLNLQLMVCKACLHLLLMVSVKVSISSVYNYMCSLVGVRIVRDLQETIYVLAIECLKIVQHLFQIAWI